MAEETIEQMNRLLGGTGAVSDMEMQGMTPPMRPQGMGAVSQAEIDMITSAQEGPTQIELLVEKSPQMNL